MDNIKKIESKKVKIEKLKSQIEDKKNEISKLEKEVKELENSDILGKIQEINIPYNELIIQLEKIKSGNHS